MALVKGKNTSIEIAVRRTLHGMGYRYRLDNDHMAGKPDLTFRKRKIAVFVNGCFWHGHSCKRGNRIPKSNRNYWKRKIGKNVQRDKIHHNALQKNGWKVYIIWECALDEGLQLLLDGLKKAYRDQ